jgi:hypothetical protein
MSLALAKVCTHKSRQTTKGQATNRILLISRCDVSRCMTYGNTELSMAQMTTMAQERDSILRIRQKVDSYDEMEELKDTVPATTHESLDTRIAFCSAQNAVRIADIAGSDEFSRWNFMLLLSRFLQVHGQLSVTRKQLGTCTVWSIMMSLFRQMMSLVCVYVDTAPPFYAHHLCLPHECRPPA